MYRYFECVFIDRHEMCAKVSSCDCDDAEGVVNTWWEGSS